MVKELNIVKSQSQSWCPDLRLYGPSSSVWHDMCYVNRKLEFEFIKFESVLSLGQMSLNYELNLWYIELNLTIDNTGNVLRHDGSDFWNNLTNSVQSDAKSIEPIYLQPVHDSIQISIIRCLVAGVCFCCLWQTSAKKEITTKKHMQE